jgi:hypothetical protein
MVVVIIVCILTSYQFISLSGKNCIYLNAASVTKLKQIVWLLCLFMNVNQISFDRFVLLRTTFGGKTTDNISISRCIVALSLICLQIDFSSYILF